MWKSCVLFCIGAFGYGQIELLYRGRTHWSMLLAGGLCLVLLGLLDGALPRRLPLLGRCGVGALVITSIELAFGLLCNVVLGLDVWDYSQEWGNLWGQICPRYTLYWLLLCLPGFMLVRSLERLRLWCQVPSGPPLQLPDATQ